ncbi:cytochrome c [Geotalea uraniireducens]|uniref:Cytochrome c n=1 Tax=Geotalea uraniireducens TaxID=351604 RepID=A0ABM8EMG1_9BACT|nr:c-type cytochrome [Geotalea uraniireducens]BDV43620.1 cytochrome c [Geotalea uraniireducens]
MCFIHERATVAGAARKAAIVLALCFVAAGCSKKEAPEAPAQPQGQMGQMMPQGAMGQMSDQQKLAMGGAIFAKKCAPCHGADGVGGTAGPSLQKAEFKYGRTAEAVATTIRNGRPGGMPAFGKDFKDIEINTLASYVLSLKK